MFFAELEIIFSFYFGIAFKIASPRHENRDG